MINDNKRTIHLKNGKKIVRVIRTSYPSEWQYVIYNGRKIGVEFICGYWYEVYN